MLSKFQMYCNNGSLAFASIMTCAFDWEISRCNMYNRTSDTEILFVKHTVSF